MIEVQVKKRFFLGRTGILWGIAALILVSVCFVLFLQYNRQASATSTAGFEAGNIIDDYVMGNKATMTESQIYV